ncbi:MAG TPA: heparinase II/III family protein [Symbiobacteriaceae bacterium]|nr:heparinase II/III family protein [Symbiobacteriaceae bacterium]
MHIVNESTLRRILQSNEAFAPFPTIADRAVWESRASHPVARIILEVAQSQASAKVPALPATLSLDFDRSGQRQPFEVQYWSRRTRLNALSLAECLVNDGSYLPTIVDLIRAILDEPTWAWNARIRPEGPAEIDVYAGTTGMLLAETDYLLGDLLPADVRARIRKEFHERLVQPYLQATVFTWDNPVSSSNIVGAALYLEDDIAVQARVLSKSLGKLPAYLDDFSAENSQYGGSSYWSMMHYALLGHLVEARTGGEIDMFDHPNMKDICRFLACMELSPGEFINFSDQARAVVKAAGICQWLGQRVGVPELVDLGRRVLPMMTTDRVHSDAYRRGRFRPEFIFRTLMWSDTAPASPAYHRATTFLRGFQWLISRYEPSDPMGLVLAAKGGHNGEDLNHNDVGQFIIHYAGESFVVDPGPRTFARDFSGEDRYEQLECRSRGHNVPVVNGREQSPGQEYGARLIGTELTAAGDRMELELAGAYSSKAGIESIRRRLSLVRMQPKGQIIVRDDFHFEDPPNLYESRVYTYHPVEQVAPGYLRLTGKNGVLAIRYDAHNVVLRLEEMQSGANTPPGRVLNRLRFVQLAHKDSMILRFVPE